MHSYELRYRERRGQPQARLAFTGEDASQALLIAHRTLCAGPAELWENGKEVCEIECRCVGASSLWLVTHPQSSRREAPRTAQ
jgi:hypothetical protein